MSNPMTSESSFTQLVAQALMSADRPLTIAEIQARVERVRPVRTRNPHTTIRGTINSLNLAASLGGRPARYTWWPRRLADNAFRQPLVASDLESGSLVLGRNAWLFFWPDFYDRSSLDQGAVTLLLADGQAFQTSIQHLVRGQPIWGLSPTPALAAWYRQQAAAPQDDLIVRVLDVEARRYALSLLRRAERDERAIAARNLSLADAAAEVLLAGWMSMPDSYLLPRLIARGVYLDPLPPDPWEEVLRADIRFIVKERSTDLAQKLVDYLERKMEVLPGFDGAPRPRGDRRKLYPELAKGARSDEKRRAWGEYLFERGMDHRRVNWSIAAEAYYREALRMDPGHADAWVHLGNSCFDEGQVVEALAHYERGQAAAEARIIGDPSRYLGGFWGDLISRPFMRALHGRGLCLWRLGRVDEARQVFSWMLKLNPDDNQGVSLLLYDLDEGLSWEQGAAQEEEWERE